jgi:uncharacterized protein
VKGTDMRILIDADACPKGAREVLFKISQRLQIELVLIANIFIKGPISPLIKNIVVGEGFNVADDKLVEICEEGDLVITADIPLADRVVKKKAIAFSPRGEIFDENTIGSRLAVRDFMEELRETGVQTGGPSSYGVKEKGEFANSLDRFLTKALRQKK